MKKMVAVLLAIILMIMAVTFAEDPAGKDGARHDRVTVGVATELTGDFFTEMWGNNASDIDVRTLLHGYALTRWQSDRATYDQDPSVVTGLTVTRDAEGNRTYTIAIADDLYYSDGTAITTADYAFSILLSASPAMAEIGADTTKTDYIVGADAYRNGAKVLRGVRVIDDLMFSVTIAAERFPYFYELAYLNFNPYPISVIAPGCEIVDDGEGVYIRNKDMTADDMTFSAELLRETVLDEETGYRSHPSVVSGPYVLRDYNAIDHTAEFERNMYFKGDATGRKPGIDSLKIICAPGEDLPALLENRTIDLINKAVGADMIGAGIALTNQGDFSAINYPRSGLAMISFNCERPVIASAAVRKAMVHCLDKEGLISNTVRNYGIAVNGYYGMSQWPYQLITGTLAKPIREPDEDSTEAEIAEYEAANEAWDALSLDDVPMYRFDVGTAIALLEADGWTLNEAGDKFDIQRDAVRCRINNEGKTEKLELQLAIAGNSLFASQLEAYFAEPLAQAGIVLAIEPVSTRELFSMYYRTSERECDMLVLGTNFTEIFDPVRTYAFEEDDEGNISYGAANYSMMADAELYQLAQALSATPAGDALTYCERWAAFQKRWAEVLPAIPLYSNVYFDFYAAELHDYALNNVQSWPMAMYGAYLSDVTIPNAT